ncbi:MAG: MarC family protein [Methanomicrobiales archaeon]|nr:MarC family protein [Methanomicrobiales archaeon]
MRDMEEFLSALLYSFGTLFVILDPLLSVPLFSEMTRGQSTSEVTRQTWIAVGVAGVLMYGFLFFNFIIFTTLEITIASFQVAGGILLFILGLQETLDFQIPTSKEHQNNAAGVVIGTPLLCGPGTITTVLLLSSRYGLLIPAIAIFLSLVATWLTLRYAALIQKLCGDVVIGIMARVLGMLLAAIAVKLIAAGITGVL